MNEHLSEDRISHWLVEGAASEDAVHARECETCRGKIQKAQEPLMMFRDSLTAWSKAQPSRAFPRAALAGRHWIRMRYGAAGLAMAAVLGWAVLAGLHVTSPAPRQPAAQSLPKPAISDAVLMQQVDEEVSESVPDAMAPLTDLVSWDSAGSGVATGSQKIRGNDGNEKQRE